MSGHGFGFTQATIWKIESGQRPVKISELVALADALDLRSWAALTLQPDVSQRSAELQAANRRAQQAYTVLKDAATRYLEEQIGVVVAVRQAQDAGLDTEMWAGWIDMPAERAVIEARVDWERQDGLLDQREERVDAALQALRQAGYQPLRPEDVEPFGSEPA
jgi:transcriptional regulator with XRE-family HTH domain